MLSEGQPAIEQLDPNDIVGVHGKRTLTIFLPAPSAAAARDCIILVCTPLLPARARERRTGGRLGCRSSQSPSVLRKANLDVAIADPRKVPFLREG